jgi:phosphohistidine phosphatase
MKRLILMRHAKSDWSRDLDDHDRPLNARGQSSAQALGQWLRDTGHLPDQILCSSATRTQETCALLQLENALQPEPELYLAAPHDMLRILHGAQGDRVLMLGHNPGIAMLAEHLVETAPEHARFRDYPTGATLVLAFNITDWKDTKPGTGRALDFVVPRELA